MADLKKILGLFFLGFIPPFSFVGGPILLPLLYMEWRYVRFCIKMDLIVIYLLIRLPIWLLIQLPLYSLGVATSKIENFFVAGLNKLRRARKTSIALILIFFPVFYLLISPEVSVSNPEFFNIFWWWEAIGTLIQTVFFTVFTVILFLSIKETLSGNIAQGEMPAAWSREQLGQAPGQAVNESVGAVKEGYDTYQQGKEAYETAKKAKGAFNDIEMSGESGGELLSGDLDATLGELADMFGLGGEAAGAEAAGAEAAGAGAAEGAALASNPIGWAIVGLILMALAFFVIQMVVVVAFFGLWIQAVLPAVLGPIGSALGIGADYGNWIGGEFGDRFIAGSAIDVEVPGYVQEIQTRIGCLTQGPACVRKALNNNTETPDSRNVGETYKLNLNRFQVGSGEQVDIAGYNGGYRIPISFGLSNARKGIYGIPARNVSYRMSMIDFERSGYSGESDPYCETGWRPIDGYNIRENVESDKYVGNDLYPGTSASTGFMRLDDFTLENCGLLQPGLGQTKTVLLEVKYDYSSEATLYFEAMSRRVFTNRPEVQTEWKASETADTPVKSVLNVESPVLYNPEEIGTDDAADPFAMRSTLTTDAQDVQYRVEDFEIRKSEQVEIADESSSCQFRPSDTDEEILVPTGDAEEQFESSDWYSSNNAPTFFGCQMELSNPAEINPTGQTLSMDVMSNYTVKLNQRIERFRILNSDCNSRNCPFLVTEQWAEDQPKSKNWKIQCTGPDSSDGCWVVQGDPDEWSDYKVLTGNDMLDQRLEQGEYAYDPIDAGIVYTGDIVVDGSTRDNGDLLRQQVNYGEIGQAAIGLSAYQINQIEGRTPDRGYAVVSVLQEDTGVRASGAEREVIFEELNTKVCEGTEPGNEFVNYQDRKNSTEPFGAKARIIAFEPLDTSCDESDSPADAERYEDLPDVGSP